MCHDVIDHTGWDTTVLIHSGLTYCVEVEKRIVDNIYFDVLVLDVHFRNPFVESTLAIPDLAVPPFSSHPTPHS